MRCWSSAAAGVDDVAFDPGSSLVTYRFGPYTLDPAAYVELWLKDSGHHGGPEYVQRYDTWLSWLEEQGIEGVGFGWINVRRGSAGSHDLLEWPYDVEQPIGPAIHAWGEAVADLRGVTDDQLLDRTLRARDDVQQEVGDGIA